MHTHFRQTIWQWMLVLGSLLVIVVGIVIVWGFGYLSKYTQSFRSSYDQLGIDTWSPFSGGILGGLSGQYAVDMNVHLIGDTVKGSGSFDLTTTYCQTPKRKLETDRFLADMGIEDTFDGTMMVTLSGERVRGDTTTFLHIDHQQMRGNATNTESQMISHILTTLANTGRVSVENAHTFGFVNASWLLTQSKNIDGIFATIASLSSQDIIDQTGYKEPGPISWLPGFLASSIKRYMIEKQWRDQKLSFVLQNINGLSSLKWLPRTYGVWTCQGNTSVSEGVLVSCKDRQNETVILTYHPGYDRPWSLIIEGQHWTVQMVANIQVKDHGYDVAIDMVYRDKTAILPHPLTISLDGRFTPIWTLPKGSGCIVPEKSVRLLEVIR